MNQMSQRQPAGGQNLPDTVPSLTVTGSRATIQLNRPRHHNRIGPEDVAALRAHFTAIEADSNIRLVVLTATGKSFSSGYHLGDLQNSLQEKEGGERKPRPDNSAFEALTVAFESLPQPTICAFNGSVYGGATDFGLAADFRIGITGMRMFMPAARLGVHYYPAGLRRYTNRLGLAAAKKLFLTAEPIFADEMLAIGYLDKVVAPEALADTVDALANTIMANAPLAVQGMKRALNDISRGEMNEDAWRASARRAMESEDAAEGVAAWHEKRTPQFRGQ